MAKKKDARPPGPAGVDDEDERGSWHLRTTGSWVFAIVLWIAGVGGTALFARDTVEVLWARTSGIPGVVSIQDCVHSKSYAICYGPFDATDGSVHRKRLELRTFTHNQPGRTEHTALLRRSSTYAWASDVNPWEQFLPATPFAFLSLVQTVWMIASWRSRRKRKRLAARAAAKAEAARVAGAQAEAARTAAARAEARAGLLAPPVPPGQPVPPGPPGMGGPPGLSRLPGPHTPPVAAPSFASGPTAAYPLVNGHGTEPAYPPEPATVHPPGPATAYPPEPAPPGYRRARGAAQPPPGTTYQPGSSTYQASAYRFDPSRTTFQVPPNGRDDPHIPPADERPPAGEWQDRHGTAPPPGPYMPRQRARRPHWERPEDG